MQQEKPVSNSSIGKPIWVLSSVLVVYVIVTVAFYQPVVAGVHDHDQAAAQHGCLNCHFEKPSEGEIVTTLRAGAAQWCLKCHADVVVDGTHPTGRVATPTGLLPLEEGNRTSCLSCHSPHQRGFSRESPVPPGLSKPTTRGYKTFYMTRLNTNAQLCRTCHDDPVYMSGSGMQVRRAEPKGSYVGSRTCMACHPDIYREWSKTPHARMVRKPEQIEYFNDIPVEGFGLATESIRLVLGSHYVHRFVAEATGTWIVLEGTYDLRNREWLAHKDAGWRQRNWFQQCAGCHTTGFDASNNTFAEPGIGCEACHGPALDHLKSADPDDILGIYNLKDDRREMICMSCHTSGVDNSGKFRFPVGYKPGDDLTQFFSGLTPKPGQTHANFYGDETFEDRRRQWDYLKSMQYLAEGLTCEYCQNFRSFEPADGSKMMTRNQHCLTCHTGELKCPPESQGKDCVSCHVPMKDREGKDSIHDHRFSFY